MSVDSRPTSEGREKRWKTSRYRHRLDRDGRLEGARLHVFVADRGNNNNSSARSRVVAIWPGAILINFDREDSCVFHAFVLFI